MTAPRSTALDVTTIISTLVDVNPFLRSAHLLVDERLASAGLSESLLTEIETWLAAHLVAVRDPRRTEVSMADVRLKYEAGPMGTGLASTRYGQHVLLLDPTGLLASSGLKRAWLTVE